MADDPGMRELLADVGHCDDDRHYPAMERLLDMGNTARDRLIALLQINDPRLRCKCLDVLGRMNDAVVQQAMLAIVREDPDPLMRSMAIPALENTTDAAAVPVLVTALEDENLVVRRWAACILGNFRTAEVIAPLTRALQHDDAWVRLHAASSLRFTGSAEARAVVAALCEHTTDPTVRDHAKQVLWEWNHPE